MLTKTSLTFLVVAALCLPTARFVKPITTHAATPQVEIRFRKHVDDMTSEEWKALGDAIAILHQKDQFGPQGPNTPSANEPFPQDHDSYEWFVQIHGNRKEAKACKHGSESIWPWHRAFLLHFENKLRAINPPSSSNITLPYWDWTETPSGQHGYPEEFEKTGSPFFHTRSQYGTDIPLVVALGGIPQGQTPAEFLESKLAGDWEEFGGTAEGPQGSAGSLEFQFHNQIHGYIGKDNANTIHAVRDPVFWAHHANLDRIWDLWQRLHVNELQCFACNAPVYDRDTQMGPLKFNDVLSNENLPGNVKVVYVPRGGASPLISMASMPSMNTMSMTVSESSKQKLSTAQISAPENGLVSYKFSVPETAGYRFQLRLVDVEVPALHTYRGSIYLYPNTMTYAATPQFRKMRRVGSFAVLANGNSMDGHGLQTVAIDITDALQSIPADQTGKAWVLTIKFESSDSQLQYKDISDEVVVGRLELVKRDFATRKTIQLRKSL